MQIGPGLEALTLGSGWDNIILALCTDDGVMGLSRFYMLDGADPTKRLFWDVSGITTSTVRTVTVPNWSGVLLLPPDFGTVAGRVLMSNGSGTQPTFQTLPAVTNALLDASNHTDTVAQGVTRGSLIYGNSTPKWDELVIGAANTVLTSNGTDVAWSANPAVQHDALAHLKPEAITVGWAKNTATVTSSAAFGNVKVGDFIYLGTNTTNSTQGARVLSIQTTSSLTADRTKDAGDTDLVGVAALFTPSDHWHDTVSLHVGTGAGYLVSTGRGTYNVTNSSGTFQEWNGPVRWGTFNDTLVTDFRVAGYSGGNVGGFGIYDASNLTRVAYWNVGSLTGPANFTLPPTGGNVMTDSSTNSSITGSKTFTGPVVLDSDGTALHTHFRTTGGATFLAFSATGTTLRNVTWPDIAGNAVVRNAAANATGQTALIASTTLATAPAVGMYRISGFMNCTSAGAGNAVLQVSWTDDTARTSETVCTLDKGATNFAEGTKVIYVGSGNVSYNVTYAGTGTYTVRVRMEAI